jgi:hypothetical protein
MRQGAPRRVAAGRYGWVLVHIGDMEAGRAEMAAQRPCSAYLNAGQSLKGRLCPSTSAQRFDRLGLSLQAWQVLGRDEDLDASRCARLASN